MGIESTQQAIGALHYNPARATKVRDTEGNPVNAVFGTMAIHVTQLTVTDALLARWPEVMQAAADKVSAIIEEAESG